MQKLITTLFDGLNQGSMYALVALGYTMVYGIAKMLNFAHGDVIMVGAFTIYCCLVSSLFSGGAMVWLMFAICIIVCALLGFFVEKAAYKPLRNASSLSVLITAIGVSYFLQNLALLIFGSRKKFLEQFIFVDNVNFSLGGETITLQGISILILVITVVIMAGLYLFIKKTKMGSAMLAVSEDKGAAQLMGINVNRTISITFIIGSALAGVAAILYASKYKTVDPYIGSVFGIKAFAAAVFGGIGSIPGAMIGGIVIGLIESVATVYLPNSLTAVSDGITYAILIFMLVIKPTGLLGKKRIEKV